ncbi:heme A synthase [Sphingobium sp. SYK-6]|uniref:COX15/CtaA family protein n=1 Tax=Sphingobium sp. (strain NBRC 103272 / SYK-6) TaxID=627192 RepID=UPI0002277FEE|nr:COX15/CtaA family protein [Sphingobium sp. SYK-6]BAK68531.1 heme A synthase [Sphingobium sp. SYK-6]
MAEFAQMTPSRASIAPGGPARPALLARWLFVIAGLILFMVAVGGVTRLTESGLSITEWKPVTGAIPPLTEADWQAEFAAYKQSSQYALMNQGMTLAAFKQIYFWEYFHRLLGRLIGLAYAVPLVWFAVRRAVPRGYGPRLVVLLLLGGAQGAVGWFMVRSGLTDRVNVEPAMLAAHLGMALILLAAVVWTACDFARLARTPHGGSAQLKLAGAIPALLLFLQILLGALTAGLRAGYVANTWPLMNDHLVPEGITWWGSFWMTITSDPFLVHFLHRWWAWVAAGAIIWMAGWLHRTGSKGLAYALLAITLAQIMLGIATVVTGVAMVLAVAHQLVGALLLGVAVMGAHRLGTPRAA